LAQYLLKRVGLALLTLVLLSLLIFFAGQVLPGDPGRAILGPFAAQSAVKALDRSLGLDRPLLTQYWSWAGIAHGDLGISYQFQAPVSSFLGPALVLSLKLAAVAFVLVVPLSIIGGVVAAMNRGRAVDRMISVTGLSLSTVPEFVSGIVLIVVFAIGLKVLPVTASAPPGAPPPPPASGFPSSSSGFPSAPLSSDFPAPPPPPPPPPDYSDSAPPPGYSGQKRPSRWSRGTSTSSSSSRSSSGDDDSIEDAVAGLVMDAATKFIGGAIGRRVKRAYEERVVPAVSAKQDAMLREQIAIAERYPELRACLTDNVVFLAGGNRVVPMSSLSRGFTLEQADAVVAQLRNG